MNYSSLVGPRRDCHRKYKQGKNAEQCEMSLAKTGGRKMNSEKQIKEDIKAKETRNPVDRALL